MWWVVEREILRFARNDKGDKAKHRQEIARFAKDVEGDEVAFVSCSYRRLLEDWARHESRGILAHADAVTRRFAP